MIAVPVAVALLIAYIWLGTAVSSRPPAGIDLAAGGLVGVATPAAAWLTFLGRSGPYALECVGVLAVGVVRRTWLGRSVCAVLLLIAADRISNSCKLLFHRPRPAHWLVTHETTYSYSSGHATNSLVFFGFWAYVALRSTLARPARFAIACALLGLSAAIGWSRLALGAHYPTDVLGGYLLAALLLDLGLTLIPARLLGLGRQKSTRRSE